MKTIGFLLVTLGFLHLFMFSCVGPDQFELHLVMKHIDKLPASEMIPREAAKSELISLNRDWGNQRDSLIIGALAMLIGSILIGLSKSKQRLEAEGTKKPQPSTPGYSPPADGRLKPER
jgi:hypothetical protein